MNTRATILMLVGSALLTCIFPAIAIAASPHPEKESVVVIKEFNGPVKGTGFVWPSDGYIVTAYHVVAGSGADTIAVSYNDGVDQKHATIERVLRSRDLVLLRVTDGEPRPSAKLRAETIQPEIPLRVYCRGLGVGQITSWHGNIRDTPVVTTLRKFLTSQSRISLERSGFPSLDADILACELSVRPGSSGAPAFDENGHVCGVVLGGLESGLGSVSWLTPATALAELQASPKVIDLDPIRADKERSNMAFSADAESSTEIEHEISGLRVVKLRTRTLKQITAANFDPLGLSAAMRLLAFRSTNGMSTPDWSNEKFDIYSIEPATSPRGVDTALIMLPAGAKMMNDSPDDLSAKDESLPFEWRLRRQTVTVVPGKWWGQNEANDFVASLGATGYWPDPNFTDPSARPAHGGYIVQRVALVKAAQVNNGIQFAPQIQGVAAITHTGKLATNGSGGVLISTGVICTDWQGAMEASPHGAQKRISLWTFAVHASGFGNTDLSSN